MSFAFVKVNKKITGPAFEYTNEYRAKEIGSPLMEKDSLRVGSQNIDIQSYAQVCTFLIDNGVSYTPLFYNGNSHVVLPLSKLKVLSLAFEEGKLNVRTMDKSFYRDYLQKASNKRKESMREALKLKLAEEDRNTKRQLDVLK